MFGRKKEMPPAEKPRKSWLAFAQRRGSDTYTGQRTAIERTFQQAMPRATDDTGRSFAMDDAGIGVNSLGAASWSVIDSGQLSFFASYGFIGHQACALIAQHWLIQKACYMPARDAVRNGWDLSVQDGSDVPPEEIDWLREQDKKHKITKQLVEMVGLGRVFGVRVVMPVVRLGSQEETDNFYRYPFNIDAIKPGSYKGLSQIDPYWIAPVLDGEAASNPASQHFYEPTYWMINGKRIHRSHLIIYRTCDLPDVLKPTYLYGGIPVPQQIAERVYCAERTANEAPLLAMTKRLNVLKTDTMVAQQNPEELEARISMLTTNRDNSGVLVIDQDDEDYAQTDTALADFDALIMTQYQLVSAIARVPAAKLLGTTPKGFNATGEYEEASYHEELSAIQVNDFEPLLERHYELLLKSHGRDYRVCIAWRPLDEMTSTELADLNLKKAQTAQALAGIGAIDGTDERERLIADPDSGYSGMSNDAPEDLGTEALGVDIAQAPTY